MWTEEQFKAWRQRRETKQFLAFLKERRETLKEAWADGEAEMNPNDHAMAMVFGDIINLNYEGDVAPYYEDEETDEE